MVHRRGEVSRAVRTSASVPGVLPPVPSDGDLLVDSGVLNNIPIDVMRDINPFGTVIAIDVVSPHSLYAKSDYGLSLSGWRLALNKLNPWRQKIWAPSIASTIMHATVAGAGRARERMLNDGLADFYFNIGVRGIGMTQFDAAGELAEMGYERSIEPLRQWLDSGPLRHLRDENRHDGGNR